MSRLNAILLILNISLFIVGCTSAISVDYERSDDAFNAIEASLIELEDVRDTVDAVQSDIGSYAGNIEDALEYGDYDEIMSSLDEIYWLTSELEGTVEQCNSIIEVIDNANYDYYEVIEETGGSSETPPQPQY